MDMVNDATVDTLALVYDYPITNMTMSYMSWSLNALFLTVLLWLFIRYWRKPHALNVVPPALTSIGVLGTFCGILLGLSVFNEEKVIESIPPLLDGLRLAFVTSVAGIFLAIVYKYFHQLEVEIDDEDDGQDVIDAMRKSLRTIQKQQKSFQDEQSKTTISLLETNTAMLASLAELVNGNQDVVRANQQVAEGNKAILRSLAGDEDGSLLTQMQKIRTTLIDKHDETKGIISEIQSVLRENTDTLVKEFREFSKHMMENASKALIEALESVIRDFNEKLTEQFGENFKQLNQAVGRMVDWLDAYKEQLEKIKQHLAASEQALQKSEDSLGNIRGDFSRVVEMSDELKAILAAYGKSKEELQQGMERFNELAELAKQSLPSVEEKVNSLTEKFSQAVSTALENSSRSVEQQAEGVRKLFEEHGQKIRAYSDAFAQDLKQVTEGVHQSVVEQRKETTKLMQEHGEFVSISTQKIEGNSQLVTDASKTLASTTESMLAEMKNTHGQLSKTVRDTSETHGRIISESVQELTETSKQLATNLAKSLESTEQEVGRQIQQLFQDVAGRNTNLINQIEETQRQHLTELDAALGKALTEALENLGNKMATVSQRFVNDYGPLADKLRDVVQIAKDI